MIDQHSQSSSRDDQKLRPKCVVIGVVGGFEFKEDEIESAIGGHQEHNLHDSVVWRDKVGEDVKVAGSEDQCK